MPEGPPDGIQGEPLTGQPRSQHPLEIMFVMVPYQPSLPQLGGATQPPPLQVPGRPGGPGGPGELMPGGPGCPGGPVQGGPGGPGGPGRPGGHTAGCVGQGGHWGAGGHTGGGTGSIGGGTGPGVGGTGTIGGGTGQGIIGHAGGIGHTGGLTGVGGYGHWAYCLLKCTLGSRSASKRSSWSTLSPPVLLPAIGRASLRRTSRKEKSLNGQRLLCEQHTSWL